MFGRNFAGRGQRGGAGLGFRGSSPPWPYAGRGRGGLPRCQYPGPSRAAADPIPTREELTILKGQAETTKRQLDDIERRIQGLQKLG